MSFDFASDDRTWRQRGDEHRRPPRLEAASPPAFVQPQRPTSAELARLVRELFREGTLSCDQLWSLACLPEFVPLLAGALEAVPDNRRPLAAE
jgi:hypothetical protein